MAQSTMRNNVVYTLRFRPEGVDRGPARIAEHGECDWLTRFTHTRLTTNNKSRSDQDFTQL